MEKGNINELISILDMVFENDQKHRRGMSEFINKYGATSEEGKKLTIDLVKIDEENLKIVEEIIDKYGWVDPNLVGFKGNKTLFLIIQHADLETQKKYYPIIEKAVSEEKAFMCDLALLKDRIEVREGRKQIYGSQIGYDSEKKVYYLYPLINPENVDKRRKAAGLGSIKEDIKLWGLTWDQEKRKIIGAGEKT